MGACRGGREGPERRGGGRGGADQLSGMLRNVIYILHSDEQVAGAG